MSEKAKENCRIISQECIGRDIYSMWLQTEKIAQNAKPGQFLSLYTRDGSKLLPRPISICEIDKEKSAIRLVYRVTGPNTGTEAFSRLHAGVPIETLGPLGNGFPLEEARGKKVFLMGGGIGIPPMLETAKQLDAEKIIILGYRDELFLKEEFESYGKVYVAAEDGSAGTKGNVMDAIRENALEADAIFAVNGDSAGFRGNGAEFENPIIIRNGEIYHEDDRNIGEMCALYKNGRLRIFSPGDLGSASEMVQDGVTDVWWFDTPLIKNGEIPQGLIEQEDCFEAAPYTAIGQKDENHFLFIVVDGRGSNGSFGVTYTGMARLMKEYGAVTAYELDGGGSSTIWFDGMVLNEPSDGVERAISDMIYVRK